jgi:kumamolisin
MANLGPFGWWASLQQAKLQSARGNLNLQRQLLAERIRRIDSLGQALAGRPWGSNLLEGSQLPSFLVSRFLRNVDPNERIEVVVHLRRKSGNSASSVAEQLSSQLPLERMGPNRDAFLEAFGADPQHIQNLQPFAQRKGLTVEFQDHARRHVVLSGTADAMSKAFGVTLGYYQRGQHQYRAYKGSIRLPAALRPSVLAVEGLSNYAVAKPKSQRPKATGAKPFTPLQLAQVYNFPQGDGADQCIGIIELGGGFDRTDLQTYFTTLGIVPTPQVLAVSVGRGKNSPGSSADDEVMLDIEVAGAIAPGAKLAVYFAPDSSSYSFLRAVAQAVHDHVNNPSVISISWGGSESSWTGMAKRAMNSVLLDAALLGVTVCVAAGDNGATDGADFVRLNVDFPASSPFALACGGTSLFATGSSITSETVWNDNQFSSATGGGVSDFFALPSYQADANVPPSANPPYNHVGRGVPDVAGDADPNTGYWILVQGQWNSIGGTSAVAPLWAGLIARINQILSTQVGFINALLYQRVPTNLTFNDITGGHNGGYTAGAGWDACSGHGSPVGTQLLQALSGGNGS